MTCTIMGAWHGMVWHLVVRAIPNDAWSSRTYIGTKCILRVFQQQRTIIGDLFPFSNDHWPDIPQRQIA